MPTPSPHRTEALSDDACLTSGDCLSVEYIGPKSRTGRPGKTKIVIEVAHVTRDSGTIFKVKRSKVNLQGAGAYCGGLPHSLLLQVFMHRTVFTLANLYRFYRFSGCSTSFFVNFLSGS